MSQRSSNESDSGDGVWRDEKRLPLRELNQAMGAAAAEGQVDDTTGGDAGAEALLGHETEPGGGGTAGAEIGAGGAGADGGDPDPDTEEGRRLRPSTVGRTGPT
jgi:hypothetical protein